MLGNIPGRSTLILPCSHNALSHSIITFIVLKSVDSSICLLPDPFPLKLQYHINMVCQACGRSELLKLLLGEDPDMGDSGVPAENDSNTRTTTASPSSRIPDIVCARAWDSQSSSC